MSKPNLKFDPSFFEGEEIQGFYVESMMKKAWASEMEVLYEVDRICKKHGISYFADSGTLLGAIRHQGFIPWDDDIDLVMFREDYNRFAAIVRQELPEGFMPQYAYFEDGKYDPHMCIFNSRIYSTNPDYLERFHGCPYVTGIDIFPLDNVPQEKELVDLHKEILRLLVYLIRLDFQNDKVEGQLQQVEELLNIHIDRQGNIQRQLSQLMERLVQIYQEDACEYVTIWDLFCTDKCPLLPKKCYEKTIQVPFEQMMLPAPYQYEEILTCYYGEDYMTPVIGTSCHEYPFYKSQIEQVEKRAKEMGIEDFRIMR